MLATLSFGKRRRRSTKKSTKKVRKPPARLLKLCKKYRVKSSKRVGKHRVYKSVSVLKRQCLKKAMALKKKLMKMHKKSKKTTRRRKTHRRGDEFGDEMGFGRRRRRTRKTHAFGDDSFGDDSFGDDLEIPEDIPMSAFGRYPQFGRSRFGGLTEDAKNMIGKQFSFGRSRFGSKQQCDTEGKKWTGINDKIGTCGPYGFGKRRSPKVSKAAAMKAFRTFYKRHCAVNRRTRFGSSNPPLVNSMGYEFCSDGVGGVLGSNSTGLFPSPCISASSSGAKAAGGFGRRKSKGTKSKGTKSKSKCTGFGRRRKTTRRKTYD